MFNIRLKETRLSLGLTQQQTADLLGATLRHYQKYESGEAKPPLDKFTDIVMALGVSADFLLGIDELKDFCSVNSVDE